MARCDRLSQKDNLRELVWPKFKMYVSSYKCKNYTKTITVLIIN